LVSSCSSSSKRDIAAQRLLVAVERDRDAVDLRGDVVELFFEAAQASFDRGEQAGYKTGIL
jgi:hypothetical protein